MANQHPTIQNGVRRAPPEPKAATSDYLHRPCTLKEALPFSPITSIPPMPSGLIPTPSIGSVSPAPILDDFIVREEWDALNKAVTTKGRSTPKPVNLMVSLFNQSKSGKYIFKKGPKLARNSVDSRPPASDGLAPISKMIYDSASVSYGYPTPETPDPGSTDGADRTTASATASPASRPAAPPRKASDSQQRGKNAAANDAAHSRNREISIAPTPLDARFPVTGNMRSTITVEISVPAKPKPQKERSRSSQATTQSVTKQTPPPAQNPEPQARLASPPQRVTEVHDSIVIPPAQSSSSQHGKKTGPKAIAIEIPSVVLNKAEYEILPDELEEPANLSTRRARHREDREALYAESLDQTQRANAASQDLIRLLSHCFDAEDTVLAQGEGNDSVLLTPENEATLTSQMQSKVQTALARAQNLRCYLAVPLDDLLHLARLSDGALKAAESLETKVDDSWEEGDVELWLPTLHVLETGMKAARTLMRIMCGGREDKQLYSEDAIDRCIAVFRNVLDGIVIPMAELRASSGTGRAFKLLSAHRKRISALITDFQKLFAIMTTLIENIDVSDSVSNTLEYMSIRLIFMEMAHAEKDSVVETQKFDALRVVAMNMLSQLFLTRPAQREGIFTEILTSLEKLPLGKQRARQFKLVDGTSIQPVSALIMRLVQASAGKYDNSKEMARAKAMESLEASDGDRPSTISGSGVAYSIQHEDQAASDHNTAIAELKDNVDRLTSAARRHAVHVSNFLVQRALKSTKTGDTPYRNLLDLFVEDFTSCLDNPDWPAAELLLRQLMGFMIKLLEDAKASAPAKNMALEILGVMGAAISNLRGFVRKAVSAMEALEQDELGNWLCNLASRALGEQQSQREEVLSWLGPYRVTLESLHGRFGQDPHLQSAMTFLTTDWAYKIIASYDKSASDVDDVISAEEYGRLAHRLREMIEDQKWLSREFDFKRTVTLNEARLSYATVLLRQSVCEYYTQILVYLLNSMSSDQATVRSKSLKSINQVLETDPSILDGPSLLDGRSHDRPGVIDRIQLCSEDRSTQVRDSALGLIGKCMNLRPALEKKLTLTVLERFTDMGPGVRKRAMKLARDIYLRNEGRSLRSAIANGLLHRVQDPEESVRELARQMIEEIWFSPYYNVQSTAEARTHLDDHVALMVQTIKVGETGTAVVLDKVLSTVLSPSSKNAQANMHVCRKLVASMFDFVDKPEPSEDNSLPSGRDVLQVLTVFAKAESQLFTFEQIRLLQPYIKSLSDIRSNDDLAVSRAVVVIYRRVLPQLSSVHDQFFRDIRSQLLPAVSKATRLLLDDIMACLWTISTLLDDFTNLVSMVSSCLTNLQNLQRAMRQKPLSELETKQFARYALIIGMTGKHCNLEGQINIIRQKHRGWKGDSVSKFVVDILVPFCSPAQPLEIRKAALDSLGLVCQSSPRNYVNVNVYETFQTVFENRNPELENMTLRSFKEFLLVEEKRSEEKDAEKTAAEPAKKEKKRELTVMGGTTHDDVASATTHRFLDKITNIALATQDDHAFLAVEVLSSINRQGLVHPKETAVTFITLETSTNPRIAELAFAQHKMLHEKHETVVEREYIKAVRSAFEYQRDIVKDPRGVLQDTFAAKLHLMMEVLKISRSKNRQKFFEKLVGQVEFDLAKLDITDDPPTHVHYSQFIIENVASLEFATIGELQATVTCVEKVVTLLGPGLAQAIETEILQIRMDAVEATPAVSATDPDSNTQPQADAADASVSDMARLDTTPSVELKRLRQLAAGSMILLMLWEARTHLRRLYGIKAATATAAKAKGAAKDLSKTPVKLQGVTGERFIEAVDRIACSLESREHMVLTAKELVELMTEDKELKIVDDEGDADADGDGVADPATPSGDDEAPDPDHQASGGTARGRKRKATSATPGRKNKRPRSDSLLRKKGRSRKNPAVETAPASNRPVDDDWDEDMF